MIDCDRPGKAEMKTGEFLALGDACRALFGPNGENTYRPRSRGDCNVNACTGYLTGGLTAVNVSMKVTRAQERRKTFQIERDNTGALSENNFSGKKLTKQVAPTGHASYK